MLGVVEFRRECVSSADGVPVGDLEVHHIRIDLPVHLVGIQHLQRTWDVSSSIVFVIECPSTGEAILHFNGVIYIVKT